MRLVCCAPGARTCPGGALKVHLVRNAKAEKRAHFDGPELLRPLTPLGLLQADALAARLRERPVARIVSSPYLRCLQTVEPVARALGVSVEASEALAKGEAPAKAVELLLALEAPEVVCCTHAELIPELAAELEEQGVAVERLPREPEDGASEGASERLGVLDLGSTSFHLLVADVTRAGRVSPVDRERMWLRLGAVIATRRHIPEDVADRAVETAAWLRRKALRFGAARVLCVATAALREADNGAELAGRIARAVGAPVRILAGEEEARLTFAAFRRRVPMPRGATLGVDLGGGSLELAVGDARRILFEASLPLGVARLHQELVRDDPMRRRELRAVCERVHEEVLPLRRALLAHEPALCIAAGGSARAMGHLAISLRGARPAASVNELLLPMEELRMMAEILSHTSQRDRLRMPGLRRRRAELLPTGALILLTLAETLGLPGYTLTDWGLREGVLLEAIGAA
jgi:exopolyphosphatase / guanosine-5'-triphosphate,3'-diphosphate pyrophosphatase